MPAKPTAARRKSALHELQPEHFEIPGEAESFGESEAANVPHEADLHRASYQHPSQAAQELELESIALIEIEPPMLT